MAGLETAPINMFLPVYEPAKVIDPGTAIPQCVVRADGVDVLVGLGIRISKSAGVLVGCN